MIVLHILYHQHNPDTLLITGEDCAGDLPLSFQGGGDIHSIPHPSSSDVTSLIALLTRFEPGITVSETELTIELPVRGKTLVCSPEWEQETHRKQAKPDSLVFFKTPGLVCPLDLLSFLPADDLCHEYGFIPAGSCRFWAGVSSLAREMVMRGRYLPTTGKYRNGGICTVWKPVPSSYDQWRIRQLVHAMPGTQQRFLAYGSEGAGTIRKETAVTLFIRAMINRIICLAEQAEPVDYGAALTPMERLRYAQELTALYFLQGIERHKMPISTPQITNGWRDSFNSWSDGQDKKIPDELPFTVCCRLDEIGSESDAVSDDHEVPHTWKVSFLIRSADAPDLLIPAGPCLTGKNLPPVVLPGPDELKNALLGVSDILLRTSPVLTCRNENLFPPDITIDEKDMVRFMTHDVPVIVKAGVEVILPNWWGTPVQKGQVRLLVRHREDTDSAPVVGLQTLLNFDYRIAVGDDIIEAAAFRQMVKEKTSVVRAGRRWVTIDHEQIARILPDVIRQAKKKTMSVADFLRLYIRSNEQEDDVSILADDDWTTNLVSCIRTGWKHESETPPASFQGTLRPYQRTGLAFLLTCRSIGFGACLADDMGLGKTPQTIAYLLSCKEKGLISGPSLLVCPTSILGNWERELARFSPGLSVYIHHGAGRRKDREFMDAACRYDLVITSYALVPRDLALLSQFTWSVLILDEVQNIKNSQTQQYQAVRTLSSVHRISLTGTPVENHLTELWAIMEILNPGYLGSLNSYQKNYAGPIEKGNAEEKAAELRRMIRPFLLRRVKTDTTVISDLPEKLEMQVYCTLTHEQAALYQATLDDLAHDLQTISGMTRRGRVLAALTRLKQICNHPSLVLKSTQTSPERSGKTRRLMEMLEEVREEGDAAIIFSQYATFARLLATQIHTGLGSEVLVMTGSTPRLKREEMITRFMRSDGPGFFVISLRAGGTGLNLMRATHVFHVDRWWNPAVEDQATDRTYRIGQTRTVQVHMMITAGTLEEQIDEMIKRKRLVANQVITAGEEWLTELPTGELMDILRLRTEVFGDDL